jgi:hypothetical protein
VLHRLAEIPIWTPLLHTHDVSSTGAGDDQILHLDERTKWLLLWRVAGGNVVACNASPSYPLMVVPIGKAYVFRVESRVATLLLQFDAAGTCQVLESVDPFHAE